MKPETWLLFLLTDAVLSATPGPAVLFVLSNAVRSGERQSVWAASGILSANAIYFALSATSLGAVIVASYRVFFLIKWLGAAYLIYLGARCLMAKMPITLQRPPVAPAISGWRTWRDGVFLQGANPKALLYFTAILPQFIDPHRSILLQVLILGVVSILIEFSILFVYGQLAGRTLSAAENPRFAKLPNRVGGALLIAAGLGLARIRRA